MTVPIIGVAGFPSVKWVFLFEQSDTSIRLDLALCSVSTQFHTQVDVANPRSSGVPESQATYHCSPIGWGTRRRIVEPGVSRTVSTTSIMDLGRTGEKASQ
ncbi:hypothetical protein CERZMDRAFT_91358 [Cercospora zeae-maydis SCOH1-5]|uniref:Uncharacterized protein n=1 Tax=Cercospora zeae-maydis SCOH1-5 TaxID=717836 RepID=A0A6A6F6L5_9PEZI|nr:hypothetical protein CERZMDRAFT_91358 [Cercospora zeae-maydis SCOH1-5]